MAWQDDPALLAQAYTASDPAGGIWQAFEMQGGGTQWVYTPGSAPAPVASAPAASSAPPHLQFSANTIGTTIFLTLGACRLPGQIIWAPGIDATNDVLDTSFLTFATAYCEPIDPTESIQIVSMSANGTLFYSAGAVLQVASVSPAAQTALEACIESMAVYHGTEIQLPDPTMEAYLGVGNVPAYRGLRYIVFQDFPIEISNNSVPNIIVEWGLVSGGLINVSDAMVKLVEHVDYRSQNAQSLADFVFGTPIVTGIDDTCNGLTIVDQSSLIDHFTAHRNLYNYQITEGDPIEIRRREVGSGLVLDISIDETDLVQRNGAPVLITNRADPAGFPVGINLTYSDPDHAFDNKVAPAMFDGSQPGRSSATSSEVISMQSSYIVDATTARSLAYSSMFNLRSYAGHVTLEMGSLEAEPGDTIAVTMNSGDVYVLLVENETITKDRSNLLQSLQLLTEAGATIQGDGGNDGGAIQRQYWPEGTLKYDFIVNEDRIWSTFETYLNYNTLAPARRISSTRYYQYSSSLINADTPIGRMFEDDTFIYWVAQPQLSIWRCNKAASVMREFVERIDIDAFIATPYGWNSNGFMNCDFKDGKLYVPWAGPNGVGNAYKLIVIDLSVWSSGAYTTYDYYTDTSPAGADQPTPVDVKVTDSGTILLVTKSSSPIGRVYYSTVSSPGSFSHIDLTVKPTTGCTTGDVAYFAEARPTDGFAGRVKQIIVIDATASPASPVASYIDITTKDSNIVSLSQKMDTTQFAIWCSDTHLFVPCNFTKSLLSPAYSDQTEREYLARLDLVTLNNANGKFMGDLVYADHTFIPYWGRYANGQLYMTLSGRSYDGRFLVIDEDLAPSTAVLHPSKGVSVPINNNFGGATSLTVGSAVSGNLFYGNTETGEPVPSWAAVGSYTWAYNNGPSVWFSFTAPASTTYTIAVADVVGAFFTQSFFSIEVYTGASLASLTPVSSTAAPGTGSAVTTRTLAATAGVKYMISVRHDMSATLEDFGSGTQFDGPTAESFGRYTIEIT